MKIRHFCTYFDHNYLPRGMVMLESLHAHCPGAIVHVLCLSKECHAALAALNYPFVRLLRLAELEAADPELLAVRPTRSLVEYYFTLTPCLPWYLLRNVPDIDAITYLDADMMFFSSPEPIFEEAGDASVILTPHRFSKALEHLTCWGIYNVSWLTFAKTQEGLEALAWYRKACLEWCFDRLEGDRFADQKYLDSFPTLFTKVHIMDHAGGGLAPWNLYGVTFAYEGNIACINGQSIIFYHAQEFKHLAWRLYAAGTEAYQLPLTNAAKIYIVKLYATTLANAVQRTQEQTQLSALNGIRWKQKRFPLISLFRRTARAFRYNALIFV